MYNTSYMLAFALVSRLRNVVSSNKVIERDCIKPIVDKIYSLMSPNDNCHDMHSTLFNAFNEQGKRFDITELEYAFYDLCSVLTAERYKHIADIVASKAVVLPRLDRIKQIISSYREPYKTCSDCPLWQREEDLRVARETAERIYKWMSNPVHHDSLLSLD